MQATFKKRLLAYVIDILIVYMAILLINVVIPKNDNIVKLTNEIEDLTREYAEEKITSDVYINRYVDINYTVAKENYVVMLIETIIIVSYFVVVPLYKDGKTLGKKFLKIKVVNKGANNVTANSLIIRNLFINSLFTTIIMLCLIYITNAKSYFYIHSILGIIQFIILAIIVNMILFRKDKRGLHDIIAKTEVIEVEE